MKNVIVLRGVSGCGKSTFANILASFDGCVAVCADDFFTDSDGNYNFNQNQLGDAHRQCQENFIEALNEPSIKCIIVSNTNTKVKDFSFYEKSAKEYGAMYISLIVENRHGHNDVHGVPHAVKMAQVSNILNSITLF